MSGIQILSFDNFSALEAHLRSLKIKYSELIKNYEETLGFILRDTRPSTIKNQQVQQRWSEEMQMALNRGDDKSKTANTRKDDGKKLFGNSKEKSDPLLGEWVSLEPISVFVGPKNKGMAEIYFDAINLLKDNVNKLTMALSICGAVKAKAAMSGNTSLIVSFVNDVPAKIVLRSSDEAQAKKYAMSFSFAVPSLPATIRSIR
jgi:hypothetical protein